MEYLLFLFLVLLKVLVMEIELVARVVLMVLVDFRWLVSVELMMIFVEYLLDLMV